MLLTPSMRQVFSCQHSKTFCRHVHTANGSTCQDWWRLCWRFARFIFRGWPKTTAFLSRSAFSGGSRTWGLVIGSPAVFLIIDHQNLGAWTSLDARLGQSIAKLVYHVFLSVRFFDEADLCSDQPSCMSLALHYQSLLFVPTTTKCNNQQFSGSMVVSRRVLWFGCSLPATVESAGSLGSTYRKATPK